MFKNQILIISDRKELSIKYKKLLSAKGHEVLYTNDLSSALSILQKEEIELIIISDTIKEKLSSFIRKIRALTYNSRPIIIAVSKSNDLEDKLSALQEGADDFLGEEISKTEFQLRVLAHLRRYSESFLNPVTRLADKNITIKTIKKSLNKEDNFAYLLIRIKGIETYLKTHGQIAYEKLLQTLSAIISSTLADNDFIGQLQEDDFFLITNPYQTEKLASFLVFAFDNIINKFYSKIELENNFVLKSSDNKEEKKESLMKINVSALEKNENEKNYRDIINRLVELIKPLQNKDISSYIIDRVKLQGKTSNLKNNVLVFELDSSLSYLLRSVCEINSIESYFAQSETEFFEIYKKKSPRVVVIDWGDGKTGLNIARKIAKDNIKLIFSSSYLNKKEILKSGADVYIPKPYEIDDMISWIKKFLDQ